MDAYLTACGHAKLKNKTNIFVTSLGGLFLTCKGNTYKQLEIAKAGNTEICTVSPSSIPETLVPQISANVYGGNRPSKILY